MSMLWNLALWHWLFLLLSVVEKTMVYFETESDVFRGFSGGVLQRGGCCSGFSGAAVGLRGEESEVPHAAACLRRVLYRRAAKGPGVACSSITSWNTSLDGKNPSFVKWEQIIRWVSTFISFILIMWSKSKHIGCLLNLFLFIYIQ